MNYSMMYVEFRDGEVIETSIKNDNWTIVMDSERKAFLEIEFEYANETSPRVLFLLSEVVSVSIDQIRPLIKGGTIEVSVS